MFLHSVYYPTNAVRNTTYIDECVNVCCIKKCICL